MSSICSPVVAIIEEDADADEAEVVEFVLIPRFRRFWSTKLLKTSFTPWFSIWAIDRTRSSSKGDAAAQVNNVATPAAAKSTNSFGEFAAAAASSKNTALNALRNNSVAPNPNRPNTIDAKKVTSALWNRERGPRTSINDWITWVVPSAGLAFSPRLLVFKWRLSTASFRVNLLQLQCREDKKLSTNL